MITYKDFDVRRDVVKREDYDFPGEPNCFSSITDTVMWIGIVILIIAGVYLIMRGAK